jgi:16S rRNA (cytidine1402-2'-O)-methyltransferase|tara:strand:- start:35 stop:733 length:699 start_codon:yes stop_codon:yes gene_type:complete
MKGKLYLIPVPIHSEEDFNIEYTPPYLIKIVNKIKIFAVENIRTSRRFLRKLNPKYDIDHTVFELINKKSDSNDFIKILEYLLNGNNVGVMSESGCPGIADPGQKICDIAHQNKISIKPLIGPSSILLALMASGLNGQKFQFHGYLPINSSERINALKKLKPYTGSHIFIETPYRNQKVFDEIINTIKDRNRKLCVAIDITGKNEKIFTKKITVLKNEVIVLKKYPTIFIIE